MKKKKNIKKEKTLKTKYFALAAVIVLVVFAALRVTQIMGTETSIVCEDKKGNLFVPRDKNGIMDDCGKHGDAVTFKFNGGVGGETNGSNAIGSGYSRFMDNNKILTEDGYVLEYKESDLDNDQIVDSGSWAKITGIKKIDDSIVNKIFYWNENYFITTDGYFYVLRNLNPNNDGVVDSEWVENGSLPIKTAN